MENLCEYFIIKNLKDRFVVTSKSIFRDGCIRFSGIVLDPPWRSLGVHLHVPDSNELFQEIPGDC